MAEPGDIGGAAAELLGGSAGQNMDPAQMMALGNQIPVAYVFIAVAIGLFFIYGFMRWTSFKKKAAIYKAACKRPTFAMARLTKDGTGDDVYEIRGNFVQTVFHQNYNTQVDMKLRSDQDLMLEEIRPGEYRFLKSFYVPTPLYNKDGTPQLDKDGNPVMGQSLAFTEILDPHTKTQHLKWNRLITDRFKNPMEKYKDLLTILGIVVMVAGLYFVSDGQNKTQLAQSGMHYQYMATENAMRERALNGTYMQEYCYTYLEPYVQANKLLMAQKNITTNG